RLPGRGPVGYAQLVGPLGGYRRVGEHDLHRRVLARGPRPALRAARAGDDAEVDLRLAQAGGLPGDDQVAHQHHLAAAAEGVAVDRGDEGLAESGERYPAPGRVAARLLDG